MPPLRALPLLAVLIAALAAACGDGGGSEAPTATVEHAAATSTPAPSGESTIPNEAGSDPVFYRTVDRFASLTAGIEYKAVLRITNGFDEATLRVVAEPVSPGQNVELAAERVMAPGEGPGTFYTMNVLIPRSGSWRLVVVAGADEVTIPVDVKPAAAPQG
jgi:hypothetical protein